MYRSTLVEVFLLEISVHNIFMYLVSTVVLNICLLFLFLYATARGSIGV